MKEELKTIKELRELKEKLKAKYQAAQDKFLATHQQLIADMKSNGLFLTEAEGNLRTIALEKYAEIGEKNLGYGVGIRIFKKLEYDSDVAFVWARDHKLALSLDKKSFEKIARADPMSFVKINEVPQATLPFKIEIEDEQTTEVDKKGGK